MNYPKRIGQGVIAPACATCSNTSSANIDTTSNNSILQSSVNFGTASDWIKNNPWLALAIAFGLGYILTKNL